MRLSAAIIAGGHSRRMGRDKALLPDRDHGTLLQRQIELLRRVAPVEILVSCRPEQTLSLPADVRRVHDAGTHGPLAGLATALSSVHGADLLLVIGVDLGRLDEGFLRRLLDASSPDRGCVPRTPAGPEPLAAAYPTSLAAEAAARLARGTDLSLRGFVQAGINAGRLRWLEVQDADAACLANWNEPADLPARPDRDGSRETARLGEHRTTQKGPPSPR